MTPVYHEVHQGSEAWHALRLGVPTASRFADIVTPTGKPVTGAARRTYMMQLLAERFTGTLADNYVSAAMLRGTELEPRARAWYELETGRTVRQVGFVTHAEHPGEYGASPDGICDDRGIEIKCPLRHNLLGMILEDAAPADYRVQVQAGMWLTGLPRWDVIVFSPDAGIPSRIWTIERDEDFIDGMAQAVLAFCADLRAAEQRITALGGTRMAALGATSSDPTDAWGGENNPPHAEAFEGRVTHEDMEDMARL